MDMVSNNLILCLNKAVKLRVVTLHGLYEILVLSETLYGLYGFNFLKVPMWTTPLDLLQGVLIRFNSETLQGLTWF